MDELHTSDLRDLIARFHAGEGAVLDTLIRCTQERLTQFARRMFFPFSGVGAGERADDVLDEALTRLTRSLRQERPTSIRDFLGLAAMGIRRELLGLARRLPANVTNRSPGVADDSSAELTRWTALHEAVELLPDDVREVFSCTFYHGWSQGRIAELLDMSDRQVRRLWIEACLRLKAAVGVLPAS